MKITVPTDYHPAFKTSLAIAISSAEGKLVKAFDLVGFTAEASAASEKWGFSLVARRGLLQRCDSILDMEGYRPDPDKLAKLTALSQIVLNLPSADTIEVDDRSAWILMDALELYTRYALGQVHVALEDFSFKDDQISKKMNEIRHFAVSNGGASFGISNSHLSDDARNAWLAKKFIHQHLSYKRNPQGGIGNSYDNPMRIGSCTKQDILIDDPEFKIPSADQRVRTRFSTDNGMKF
jgi:hypothetical protein